MSNRTGEQIRMTPSKPKKTERELQTPIMEEVRKRPQCRNIQDVAIWRRVQSASHLPNWDFAWIMRGPALAPHTADEIAQKIRREYDLIS